MTADLTDALTGYTTAVLGSIGTLAIVAAVGLACVLLLYGVVRR